jgi:DMSO/TMAO reductase YedYZ molybdopterin-dependent catalytic subunit
MGLFSAGVLAGLVAALLMTLVMALLRAVAGVPSPAELVGERIVPLLTIAQFFKLFDLVGGYNNLKQLGVGGIIAGQLVFGIVAGLLYAILVERDRVRAPERIWRWGISRQGWRVTTALIALAWSVSLAALWPTLGANFRGLPPGSARIATSAGLLLDYICFGLALAIIHRTLTNSSPIVQPAPVDAKVISRRAFLAAGAGTLFGLASGTILRRMYALATFSYDGTRYRGPNVQPITPNDQFYVVTKNVVDPMVVAGVWRFEIGGLAAQPQTYRFDNLVAMPAITQETTLMCISNAVGDGLMSNAIWEGVPLRALLEAAGPMPGVVEAKLYGADGYTETIPFQKAMEPTTLVVFRMNGEPIPARHGYPVRLIVPGMFGEKHVKWLTRIELIDYDGKGFYEQQGWGPNFVIPIHARFDAPRLERPLPVKRPVQIKGIAFAGDKGIAKVEVSTDDGTTWNEAQLDYPGTMRSWALWSFGWTPAQPGEYHWLVRATDRSGTLQRAERRGIAPQGSSGYHRVTARVV